ncbi:hypothetical protein B0H10DRAFT_590793 [Mycena sp. CBHHK59/15]|nr:hypothetical protein B0H10DRAFT_590793 [Mycena sp. CBHHK59/15]
MASGCCYAFVVGVFGKFARLFRVDRSGYLVSKAFKWVKETEVFPEFYWRLYNSGNSKKLLGHDSTISVPSEAEKEVMWATLKTLPRYASLSFEDATNSSRWVEVEIDGKLKKCFTVGAPIFQSKGLFCRGTRVDRVLIKDEQPPKMHALKDAWRQACRRPESHFYDVIKSYVDENLDGKMPKGLAARLGGLDLAKTCPDHKTITAELRAGGQPLLDRCHDRTVLDPVGFPLEQFQSTKQLVQALRDAIYGHQIAFLAGVLHRDVSAGNILINENDLYGFMHDWDYSEFTAEGWKRFKLLHPDVTDEEIDKELKDMTGTYPFLAIEMLQQIRDPKSPCCHTCKHDLESFYWLLIWILLRHANHSDPRGPAACSILFDNPLIDIVISMKQTWLLPALATRNVDRLPILGNAPLSNLVDVLTCIFCDQAGWVRKIDATYDSVLAAFDGALSSPGWPDSDPALPFELASTDRATVEPIAPHTTSYSMSSHSAASGSMRSRLLARLPDFSAHALGEAGGSSSSGHKRKRDADDEGDAREDDNEDDEEADDEEDVGGVAYTRARGNGRRGRSFMDCYEEREFRSEEQEPQQGPQSEKRFSWPTKPTPKRPCV